MHHPGARRGCMIRNAHPPRNLARNDHGRHVLCNDVHKNQQPWPQWPQPRQCAPGARGVMGHCCPPWPPASGFWENRPARGDLNLGRRSEMCIPKRWIHKRYHDAYLYMCIPTYVYIYIIYIYIYIHTHMHCACMYAYTLCAWYIYIYTHIRMHMRESVAYK